jgi:hypothetical protein
VLVIKEFPGWYPIKVDEEIKQGDVWVWCSTSECKNDLRHPETSAMADLHIARLSRILTQLECGNIARWRIYRRISQDNPGYVAAARPRLPMNPFYSQPLPLP